MTTAPVVRDILLIAVAGFVLLAVPLLLTAILILHRRQINQLRGLEHPAADQLLADARRARDEALTVHRRRLVQLDGVVKSICGEVDIRLRILDDVENRIRRLRAAHLRTLAEVRESYRAADGDLLTLVLTQGNLDVLDRIEALTSVLRETDRKTKQALTSNSNDTPMHSVRREERYE